jgi:hypothetical protein
MIASLLFGLIADLNDSDARLLVSGIAHQVLDLSASRTQGAVSWIR